MECISSPDLGMNQGLNGYRYHYLRDEQRTTENEYNINTTVVISLCKKILFCWCFSVFGLRTSKGEKIRTRFGSTS